MDKYLQSMRVLFFSLILCWFALPLKGADSLHIYVFQAPLENEVFLGEQLAILLEKQGTSYSPEQVLAIPEATFSQSNLPPASGTPLRAWLRIRLQNPTDRAQYGYFRFCYKADTVQAFRLQGGQVAESSLSGQFLPPAEKALLSVQNYLPVSLRAGESQDWLFKLSFSHYEGPFHLRELYLLPARELNRRQLYQMAGQGLYGGIMLLFCLVSFFMYVVFREKVLLYYGGAMFCFALYFPFLFQVLQIFIPWGAFRYSFFLQQVVISGILLFSFLFFHTYLQVEKKLPVFHRINLFFTLGLTLLPPLLLILGVAPQTLSNPFNLFSVIWIVMLFIPLVILLRKGERTARILFISAIILALTTLLSVLRSMGWIPGSFIGRNGMQIGILFYSAVLFYGLFERVNAIRSEKEHFQELEKLKSRFFANISHEFRTPLTLIMGPVRQLMESEANSGKLKLLQAAHRNAQRLLFLVNELLDLSRLEAGKMELSLQTENLTVLLKGIVMSFDSLAQRKGIRLHFASSREEMWLELDRDKIEKICYNLLSNAFKFTPEGGEVSVLLTETGKQVEIQVQDTGIGIPKSLQDLIFKRFYQVDHSDKRNYEGSGIGLALASELVALCGGKIEVKSKVGVGTRFRVLLPMLPPSAPGNPDLSESEEAAKAVSPEVLLEGIATMPQQPPAAEEPVSAKAPLILIVEDHPDVRAYIRQNLEGDYQIREATNGEEGQAKALEYLPDLIISDVMMPGMNGYELCKAIKTDPRSSHIPLILLTAKAEQDEKLIGLKSGADDYLFKPFDSRELSVRVRNLIELRRLLRQRFASTPDLPVRSLGTNAVDKAFLEQVVSVIEDNLDNEQFGVAQLAKEVGMSQGHLNRKLKALTDHSTNKFIQTFRLQQAKKMLIEKQGNVSEIAFRTGFSSPAYFVKCFREKYEVTPGAILKEE
jgi:signal transduction histidine kinase/DNA-binding response OmpR family regulator